MLDTVIWVLGVLVLVRLAYKVGRFVYKYALRPAADLRPYGAKSGGWAGENALTFVLPLSDFVLIFFDPLPSQLLQELLMELANHSPLNWPNVDLTSS